MYTLEQLQQKNLKELKEIGWQLNVVPEGDRRCRQNWIDALVGVQPPLLQLLEDSPGVEFEPVQEAIEIPAQESESLSTAHPCPHCDAVHSLYESTDLFGRRTINCLNCEFSRVLFSDEDDCAPIAAVIFNDEQPPNRGDGKSRIELDLFEAKAHVIPDSCTAETEPKLSQSALEQTLKTSPGVETTPVGIALSDRFLARYAPPCPEPIRFNADEDGQLNLFGFELPVVNEPPDPDDYDSMFAFWAAYDAWDIITADADQGFSDSSQPVEPLEVSIESFCEWAPCPPDWYEPTSMSEVMELSQSIPSEGCANETSSTCNFSIPTFDTWCDRPNQQNDSDEPPDTGIFARSPKPKPPSFPSLSVVLGDRAKRQEVRPLRAHLSGRAPPGGDVMP